MAAAVDRELKRAALDVAEETLLLRKMLLRFRRNALPGTKLAGNFLQREAG